MSTRRPSVTPSHFTRLCDRLDVDIELDDPDVQIELRKQLVAILVAIQIKAVQREEAAAQAERAATRGTFVSPTDAR